MHAVFSSYADLNGFSDRNIEKRDFATHIEESHAYRTKMIVRHWKYSCLWLHAFSPRACVAYLSSDVNRTKDIYINIPFAS